MAGIIVSEASAKNDMLYGKWQAPIASFLEKRAEAIDQGSIAAKIFKQVNSTHWAESYGSLTAIDDFTPTAENGAYPISDFEQGYSKIIKNYTWKNSFAISREMLEDGNRESILKKALSTIRDDYDYIIIDCSPSLGLITVNSLTAADSVMIPVQPEFFALEGLGKLLQTIRLVQGGPNPDLTIEGFVVTMFDGILVAVSEHNDVHDLVR